MADFINRDTNLRVDTNKNNSADELKYNFQGELKSAEANAEKRGVEIKADRMAVVVEQWGSNGTDRLNSLSGIAGLMSQKLGRTVTVDELAAINGIKNKNIIQPGQIILGPDAVSKQLAANGNESRGPTGNNDPINNISESFKKVEDKEQRYTQLREIIDQSAPISQVGTEAALKGYLKSLDTNEEVDANVNRLKTDYATNDVMLSAINGATANELAANGNESEDPAAQINSAIDNTSNAFKQIEDKEQRYTQLREIIDQSAPISQTGTEATIKGYLNSLDAGDVEANISRLRTDYANNDVMLGAINGATENKYAENQTLNSPEPNQGS